MTDSHDANPLHPHANQLLDWMAWTMSEVDECVDAIPSETEPGIDFVSEAFDVLGTVIGALSTIPATTLVAALELRSMKIAARGGDHDVVPGVVALLTKHQGPVRHELTKALMRHMQRPKHKSFRQRFGR